MTLTPPAGSIVTVWEGGELTLGVVAGEEKRRVRLILEGGREIRVALARIGWEVEPAGPVPGDTAEARREAGRRVERAERGVAELAAAIDVPVLWEIAAEEARGARGHSEFETVELADLALDDRSGTAMTALARAVRADGLHFTRKGDCWEPRDPEQVAQLRLERERVATRENETGAFFEALRRTVREGEFRRSGGEFESRYLAALRELAIHDEATAEPARALALAALEASGLRYDRPHEGAFRLLRAAGELAHDDVNLQVLRYGLRVAFPDSVLAEAASAAARGFDASGREDLTALDVLTIDGPRTREVDDGLSAEPLDGGVRLGVHIADPGAFVRPDDPVDREAQSRGLTHYHPDLRLPMLPPSLSEDAASLAAGLVRPALSFLVELDESGAMRASRVVRSVIRTRLRLDYDEADRRAAERQGPQGELLARLARLGEAREALRLARGAISLRGGEVDLHVGAAGSVELERIDPASPSRRAVSEAMILAGEIAAALCVERGLPVIFRRQAPADPALGASGAAVTDPIAVRRIRRGLSRAETSVRPAPHHGLGLAAYVQVTSPLRRYQDLATQRQIAAHLAGEAPPYNEETLRRVAATTEQAELDARRAERAAEDYWVLRYLESFVGRTIEALVLETDPRPVVLLLETLREQPMPSLAGVEPGRRVSLAVQRVNPRAGLLVLRPAEP